MGRFTNLFSVAALRAAAIFSLAPEQTLRLSYHEGFQVPAYAEYFLRADLGDPQASVIPAHVTVLPPTRIDDDLLDAVVVTSGRYAYRRPEDGVAVVPAALLGP